mgnify:CR=1 FL=1
MSEQPLVDSDGRAWPRITKANAAELGMQWVGVLCMLVICVVVICGSASSSPAQQRVMVESHRRSAQGPLAVVAEKPRVLWSIIALALPLHFVIRTYVMQRIRK